MIYEMRIARIRPRRVGYATDMAKRSFVEIGHKYGIKVVGAWTTTIGQGHTFVLILAFDDLADRDRKLAALAADEDRLTLIETTESVGLEEDVWIMRPTDWSPLL